MAMCWLAKGTEPVKYERDHAPAHYSWKIQSFSSFPKSAKFESGAFEAGGYNWSLRLNPSGDRSGYISLYLSIKETANPRDRREVNVTYKLFVYDQHRKKYMTIQDPDGTVRTFNHEKTQWGSPRFLSKQKFKKRLNGFLVINSCTFGAEVYVIKPSSEIKEPLNLWKNPPNNTHDWTFHNWSTSGPNQDSPAFYIGGRNWKLMVFRNGYDGRGNSLSIFLQVQELPPKERVYAQCHSHVRDQLNFDNKREREVDGWLIASNPTLVYRDFMPLRDLENRENGFVFNDAVIVEAQIHAISTVPIF